MASPWRGAYRDLQSVVAVDRYTVDFMLKQPSGSFLPNLVMTIVPAGASRDLRNHPVGTGPYQFVRTRSTIVCRCVRSATTSKGSRVTPASS